MWSRTIGRPIRVVGMHLDLSGLWRKRQVRAIIDAIERRPQKMPTVLMGDTNEWRTEAGCLKELNGEFQVAPLKTQTSPPPPPPPPQVRRPPPPPPPLPKVTPGPQGPHAD